MNFLKSLDIKIKILLPTVIIIFVYSVFSVKNSMLFYSENLEEQFLFKKEKQKKHFEKNLEHIKKELLEIVTFFLIFPETTEAYKLIMNDTIPIKDIYKILNDKLNFLRKEINQTGKFNYDFNFFNKDGASLHELKNSRPNETVKIRKSLDYLGVSQTKFSGLEISKRGLRVRGILPVFADEKKKNYAGAIEAYTSLGKVIELLNLDENEEFAILVYSKEFENNETYTKSYENRYLPISDFYMVNYSSANFQTNNIDSIFLLKSFFGEENEISLKKNNYFYSFFKIKDFEEKPIAICIYQLNIHNIEKKFVAYKYRIFFTTFFSFIMIIILIYVVILFFSKKVFLIQKTLEKIVNKDRNINKSYSSNEDQFGIILNDLNFIIKKTKDLEVFTKKIKDGDFKAKLRNFNEKNILDKSMVSIQSVLEKAKKDEILRIEEDKKRNWSIKGYSDLGRILREDSENIENIAYNSLKFLIEYLKCNQGGFFIVNDNNKENIFLEQIASYAYNRKKFVQKIINKNEGLIGRVYQESETIYLTEIPKNYLTIKSGTGGKSPKSILIVPVMRNNKIFGIIEIASFENFKDFEIEFVENTGEIIAATLATLKNSTNFISLVIDSIPYPVFYRDEKGIYINCNKAFYDYIGVSKDKIINKNIFDIYSKKLANKFHKKDMELINSKKKQIYESQIEYSDGSLKDVILHKTPVFSKDGSIFGILGVIVDNNKKIKK